MLHPSYTDLMAVVNSDVEPGEQPVVQSRYSIVLATAKRARQLISGQEPLVKAKGKEIKPHCLETLSEGEGLWLNTDVFWLQREYAKECRNERTCFC